MPSPDAHILIFIPSFGDGGVERMLVNMARGLSDRGLRVTVWTRHRDVPYLSLLPNGVTVATPAHQGTLRHFMSFIRQVRKDPPDVVLVGKDQALKTALRARRIGRATFRLVMRPGTTVSARLADRSRWRRRRAYRSLRRSYRQADRVVANSHGVAADIADITGIPEAEIPVIRNPVITPELAGLSRAAVDHPWFASAAPPVILGVGGLRRQKDFATLLRAFAVVRAARPVRLVILGRGRLRDELQALAEELAVEADVDLHGFVENPYPYIAAARLFVLSSRWEGSPNVLTEALALGTPVVSTDCPSGPREILADGRYGPLVPPGDPPRLAEAMLQVLDAPLPAESLSQAAREYTMERNAEGYESLLRTLL